MLLRCKLNRPTGTHVELGKGKSKRDYHFKPVDDKKENKDDHVCEVEDADDIGTLLAIREAYEIHPSELKGKNAKAAQAAQTEAGTDEDEDPDAKADADKSNSGDQATGPLHYGKMEKADLIILVAKRTKKDPHPSTSKAKLIKMLEELDAAD